ncbi:MAG TPA: DUF3280 domain-containing protein [Azospirillum sp.]|nr:DUF3280 domain-containing protein [Azospirillum sp.]
MRRALLVVALLLLPSMAPAAALADPPLRVLVFDMEITDTSGEGEHPDHAGRLQRMTALLSEGLAASGRLAVTRIRDTPYASELPDAIRFCNGCEIDLGRKAGADIVVTGLIHKISTLVLSVRIIMRRTSDGEPVAVGIADIRGDNERAWRHGVEWLLRNRLAPPP